MSPPFFCHPKVMAKKNNLLQMSLLTLFLIVMPLGSWYFLNKGYNYYDKAIKELQDYGPMPDFQLMSQTGKQLTKKDIEGKMAVVAFVRPEDTENAKMMEYLGLVHKQFDKRSDLVLLIHLQTNEAQSVEAMEAIAKRCGLTDDRQCFFLTGSSQTMQNLLSKSYQVPDLNSKTEEQVKYSLREANASEMDYPYLVLTDIGQHICNYYDANDKSSVNRMVEHIALKLPKDKEDDPELKREKEK